EQMRAKLLAANAAINWVPGHIKQGRMGNWLEGAIDWAISRNRYWGTPLPIWINDETGAMECLGSREELAKLTGVQVEDLHRENVDPLTFSKEGEPGTYRRIEEVLDCWFESGAMPYAQLHYPFENQQLFQQGFPAEFISEGLDQTRGWFYTLIVLGVALFDTQPFKNVIASGIVTAEDGRKMSKRLRNYTPPDDLMEKYGADALRLYLINSGLVKGEEQRFADEGVKDMVRRALLPWLNAFKFLHTYATIDEWQPDAVVNKSANKLSSKSANIMDQWLLSRLESLKAGIAREMDGYRLYNVVPALFEFIEDLTNWYIRLNRSRFWGEGKGKDMDDDKARAYQTLYQTLHELCLTMAPFAPFLAETLYRALPGRDGLPESVHLCPYPEADEARIKPLLEKAVTRMQHVILLGRQKRNQEKIGTRYPLASLKVIHRDAELLNEIKRLEGYLQAELNVKQISYEQKEEDYILLYAKPNSPVLGKRLGKRFKDYKSAIEALDSDTIARFQTTGSLTIDGETFAAEDILVFREARPGTNALSDRFVSIDLDCHLTEALTQEGLAREVVNRVQKSRKDAGLNVTDRIRLTVFASERLAQAIQAHEDYFKHETLTTQLELTPSKNNKPKETDTTHSFTFQIDEEHLSFSIEVAAASH
ncbi:MAG: class I tRNA ligase family protein, partial [Pseudomonadales bacterium]